MSSTYIRSTHPLTSLAHVFLHGRLCVDVQRRHVQYSIALPRKPLLHTMYSTAKTSSASGFMGACCTMCTYTLLLLSLEISDRDRHCLMVGGGRACHIAITDEDSARLSIQEEEEEEATAAAF